MAWRQGRRVIKVECKTRLDTMQAAGWVKQVIDTDKPKRVFNFGSAPFEPAPRDAHGRPSGGPANRRAEMWMKSKDWLADPGGAQIPDSDALQADACGPGYGYDSNTRLLLEKKDDMRRRGAASPDQWDAVALTFAEPVADRLAHWSRRLVYPDLGVV